MLNIFQPPESFSFGLEDRFNDRMVKALNACGVHCTAKRLWSDFWARHLFFSDLPHAYRLYRSFVAPVYCRIHLLAIHSHDVVWINGPSLPITDTGCWFEKQVIQRGASYIFWLEDDYFSDPRLKDTAEARMELAHLIVAVTPNLRDRIAQLFKDRRLILLEEPIDVDRLSPRDASKERKHPLVLWSGRPWALKQLLFLDNVLEKVFRDFPFILRIVTGTKRPEISLSIPWEWMPYDRSREAEYACGAIAGLAPLENNVFNSCKGNYKVKTYMALGVPPLASAIGYNHQLIKHGETGFLARSNQEWEEALRLVLKDFGFAKRVGSAAREEMVNRYSYNALMPIWAETLKKAFPGKLGPIR